VNSLSVFVEFLYHVNWFAFLFIMTAIKFENISKQYRLGLVSTQTLSHDLNRWFQLNIRRREDPYLRIGEVNDRSTKGETDYVWALRDINFEVNQGDVLGIIGKNGAGKSTLLKILSKVTAPTTGTIKARGRIASLLEVGTGFHPEMTGRENIYMNGAIMGMTKAEITRKLEEIVDFSGVERYIDTPTKRYSSGMTVRLGFAIAAHLDPEILVVDEVLAVGDAEFQKKAIGKMQDVSKGEGRTVLFVSHNMASIKKLCTRGVLMNNGQISALGQIDEIIDSYVKMNSNLTKRFAEWDNNLGKVVCIRSVKLIVQNKDQYSLIDIKDVLKVEIIYEVNEDISNTNISFALNKDGLVLFRTWDIDSHPELFTYRKKGKYRTELILPDFLQPGLYSIYVATGKPNFGGIDVKEDVITFEIENITVDGVAQSFTRGGMVKAMIDWNNERIC
jgi:lipopolysaccharide transport system ATP-binding protein